MKFNIQILSPLDQFEIRDLLSIDLPIFDNLHLSLTNIGLYLILGTSIIALISYSADNYGKLVSNN